MFITSFGEQNITYKCCSNFLIHLLEASRRDAEAQIVLAESSQRAIELVTSAVGDKEIPVAYLLGEQYVKAMQDMSKSNNAKTVVLPADILSTIRGIMGRGN